jgi:hypothetical protein
MRGLLVFLLMLNGLYCIWHLQQGPLRPVEVAPVALYQGTRRDIQLLSERALGGFRGSKTQTVTREGEKVCLFLGFFADRARADAVEQRLLSLGIVSELQEVEAPGGVEYWVYLPPLASRQASLRQLRELQARKIDSYIITQGELTDGLSLGLFAYRDSADSVMKRLRDAGYEPLLKELPRDERSYWVRIAAQDKALVDVAMLRRLSFDFKGLQHQLMPCDGLARR